MLDSPFFVVAEGWGLGALLLGAADAEPPKGILNLVFSPVGMIAVLLVLFYVMVLLPEKRTRKQLAARLAALKKNDRIVTVGGIYATVVSATDDDCVVIRVDDNNNTRLQVSRSAISRVVSDNEEAQNKSKVS